MAGDSDQPDLSHIEVTRRLAVRAYKRSGGARRLAIAALVGAILATAGFFWGSTLLGRCGMVQLASQLAGSGTRFDWLMQRCPVSVTPTPMLLADLLFIAGYWLTCAAVLIGGWWRYEAPALRRASWVLWLPTAVAVADVIENLLLATLLHALARPDRGYYWELAGEAELHLDGDWTGFLNWALLTVSWTKWMLALALVVAVLMAAAVWFSRRKDSFPPAPVAPRHEDQSRDLDARDPGPNDPEMAQLLASAGVVARSGVRSPVAGSAEAAAGQPAQQMVAAPSRVGICLSGGGIRSTAFCLGVLSQLEGVGTGPTPTTSARYLAAVSGGSWAAATWTLQKALRPDTGAADRVIDGLKQSAEPAGYQRQKYLVNSRGGIVGALGWMLFSAFTNLLLVALLIYLVAWPLGWFMSRCVIDSGRLGPERCGPALLRRFAAPEIPHDHLHAPAVVFAVLGVLWLIGCGCFNKRGASTWPVGVALLGMSLFSAAYLDWIPSLFALTGEERAAAIAAAGSALGGSVVVSIAAGVWKLVGGPLVKEVTGVLPRVLPRLLGFVLLAGILAWALTVMYFVSRSTLPGANKPVAWVSSWWGYAIPVALLVGMFVVLGPNWPTLHNVFSARLRRSFDPVSHPLPGGGEVTPNNRAAVAVPTSPPAVPGTWAWLRSKTVAEGQSAASDATDRADQVPELILCCAQQRNGLAKGGLRAETFTVSPTFVRQGAETYPTDEYIATARHVERIRGRSLEFGELEHVSTWLATSGAAFSSAMGRASLGSTNAFLAAVNADLGMWLPNVKTLRKQGVAAETERLTLEAEILKLRKARDSLAWDRLAVPGATTAFEKLAQDRDEFHQKVEKLRRYINSQMEHLEKRTQRHQPHAKWISRTTAVELQTLTRRLADLARAQNTSATTLNTPTLIPTGAETFDDDSDQPGVDEAANVAQQIEAIDAAIGEMQTRLDRLPGDQARSHLPRPRFAYIIKEILGWYNSDDRYVFITDGGHWDNLGLVELLRRGCDQIYCVDASGDRPGSFATLRESLQLAALELDYNTEIIDLEDVLKDMSPRTAKALPAKIATTFTLRRNPANSDAHPDVAPAVATVYYTKLQSVQGMTEDLKRWAIADPKFPHYSTAQQFLRASQFSNLVELGRVAGAAVLAVAREQSGGPAVPPNS